MALSRRFGPGNVLSLVLFEHTLDRVRPFYEAGVREFMVDHETRGKPRRQSAVDTEINNAPLACIAPLAALSGVRVHCRINGWGPHSRDEIAAAVDGGAARIYLPMAAGRRDVEAFLRTLDGRAEAAILIETEPAARQSAAFADLPLQAIFVGLNDLAISRRHSFIFSALADGTLERVRASLPGVQFGFGGATCVDRGEPIPAPWLLSELAALDGGFTFMRRSFRRDVQGRDIAAEIQKIQALWVQLRARGPDEIQRDRHRLHQLIRTLDAA